MLNQSMRT